MAVPVDVRVISEVDGTRVVLPVRAPFGPRAMNLAPIIFGLVFSGFALFWMAGASGIFEGRPHREPPAQVEPGPEAPAAEDAPEAGFEWSRLVFALFGVPFFVVGLVPIGIGIAGFLPSHAEIVITSSELIAIDWIGPFRLRFRRPIGQVKGLRIGQTFARTAQGGQSLPRNHGIFAEMAAAPGAPVPPPLRLAQRYSQETLIPIAEFLLEELKRRGATALREAEQEGQGLAIDPEPAADAVPTTAPVAEPALPQPEKSRISFIPEPDALTFIIPRTGFRGTAMFFLMFSLLWDGISFPIFAMMLVRLINNPTMENLGTVGFLSIFVAVGVGILLAAIQTAFRRAVIVASREALVFTQTGPIRKSEHQWKPGELTAIRCADSGTKINEKPLKHLEVHAAGAKRGVLPGRDEEELEWLASVLRHFYQVGG